MGPATGPTTPNSVATTTSPDIRTESGPSSKCASRKGSNNTGSMHKKKNMIHPVKPAIFTSNDENRKNDVIHKEKGIQKNIISSKNKELLTSIITSNKNVKGEKKNEVVPIPKTKHHFFLQGFLSQL